MRIPAKTITHSGSWRSGNPVHGDQPEGRRHWK
jgi:hypothetical protein